MKPAKLAVAALLLGALLAEVACAQYPASSSQSAQVPQAGYPSLGNPRYAAGDYPSAPSAAPIGRQTAYLGDEPAASQGAAKAEENGEEEEKKEEDEGFKLFNLPRLKCRGIDIRGWVEQGYTWNPDHPADRFNGPIGYNDRSNEYMMNQMYLITERVTKTEDRNFDLGGRVDLLYGTDRRFPFAFGLDDQWNGNQRFYGLAMPQLYGDLAYKSSILRVGHILAPCGLESVMAPENFFYSHSYTFLYAQPTTVTGAQWIWKLNDRFSLNAGLDTGWNNWEALVNDKLSYYGGLNWTSASERTTVGFEMFIGDQLPDVASTRTHYALILTQKLGEKWKYGLEHNYGFETNSVATQTGRSDALWWSFVNYLYYELNDKWSFGIRYEYINDQDGAIILGAGAPHFVNVPLAPGRWNDFTLGLNYKCNKNILWRSEVRWDSMSRPDGGVPAFDDQTKTRQFLWGNDLIVKF